MPENRQSNYDQVIENLEIEIPGNGSGGTDSQISAGS